MIIFVLLCSKKMRTKSLNQVIKIMGMKKILFKTEGKKPNWFRSQEKRTLAFLKSYSTLEPYTAFNIVYFGVQKC
jgi:hypothetical protein